MKLQIVLSKDLSDALPFILSRAVISDRGSGVSLLTDAMRTPLYTELQMHHWHWAKLQTNPHGKETILSLLPLHAHCAQSILLQLDRRNEKGSGREAVQRASVEGGGSPGYLSFARLF